MTDIVEVYPGTAQRFVNVVTDVNGLYTSVPLTFELRSQDGSVVISGTVVANTDPKSGAPSLGFNYSDVLIPLTAPPGLWREHWEATNAMVIDMNRNDFRRIRVNRLPP
jgi:hypothetical protein